VVLVLLTSSVSSCVLSEEVLTSVVGIVDDAVLETPEAEDDEDESLL
jgi:hypothetical protein